MGPSQEYYIGFMQKPAVENIAYNTDTLLWLFYFLKLFKDDLNVLTLNPSISVL